MQRGYWQTLTATRLARRRMLATTGGAAAAAAFLAACGGSDSSDDGVPKSSLITPAEDTSKQAKRGGVLKEWSNDSIQTFDPHFTSLPNQSPTNMAYQRLFVEKPGYLERSTGELVNDLAQSYEFSGDKLTLTVKLRTNDHFSPLAPTNGRTVDAQDVVFSSKRVEAQGTAKANLYNSVNPLAPIVSVSAIDSSTVQIKLSKPLSSVLALIAASTAGNLHIVPREAETFDLRGDQRGSAYWYLSDYQPSVKLTYKRNPGYHDPEHPFMDGLEMPILTEYTQGLAQLKTGNLHRYDVRAEDVLATKRDAPQLAMYQTDLISTGNGRIFYGFSPNAKAYFKDVRLRQAFALTWDRELWIDSIYNVGKLQAEGLPVNIGYDTAFTANYYTGLWIDPLSKDFGENSRYFKKDIAEAKKLLSAAGFANGFTFDSNLVTTGYSAEFNRRVEALVGMGQEAGIIAQNNPVNFDTDWRPKYTLSLGQFEGAAYIPAGGGADPAEAIAVNYYPGGQFFMGFTPDGSSTKGGDPYITDLVDRMRLEFDFEKKKAMALDFQRYEAKTQYFPRFPGCASGFELLNPAIRNRNVYRNGTWRGFYEWYDASKAMT